MAPVRLLHCHSTFAPGGKELRAVRLMNAFGASASHTVVTATRGALGAREAIAPGVACSFPEDAPSLTGAPTPRRLWRLARFMRGFDLVLTYNWGAFDAVMARRLFGGPPLVHHEDGFNEDEAERLDPRRNLYRRLGLPAAARLVVPSRRLEQVALRDWRQPRWRVARIPNGIDLATFSRPPSAPIPGLERRPGEIVVGTVAGLRAVKNLPRLVRAVAATGRDELRLVIVGSGPESEQIADAARSLGIGSRLLMPGHLPDPGRWIGHFDIFALSSDSEQFPVSLVEALAAGLPVVATAVGDIPHMVAADNLPLIVAPQDEAGFAAALASLADQPSLRRAIGAANRVRAQGEYGEEAMIAAYARLYGEALGRPGALGPG
jgi:glycosyltransferase involved in cell wall biosynthesis